ncbi:MAG: hypothetical protein Q8Q20_03420 [bacterium]|nr:hypothetical protein [bacterium]
MQKENSQNSALFSASKGSQETDAFIAERPVSWYVKSVMRPAIAAIALLVGAEFTEAIPMLDWIVALAVSMYLGWRVANQPKAGIIHSIVAGGFGGAIIGFSVSVFRFILHLEFYRFFEMITAPITLAVVGMLLAGTIAWTVERIVRARSKQNVTHNS